MPITKDGAINLWWGLVMLVFGVMMLLVSRPRNPTCNNFPSS